MRSLIVTENITVGGRIEMLDDWFDPADDAEDVQASRTDTLLAHGHRG